MVRILDLGLPFSSVVDLRWKLGFLNAGGKVVRLMVEEEEEMEEEVVRKVEEVEDMDDRSKESEGLKRLIFDAGEDKDGVTEFEEF